MDPRTVVVRLARQFENLDALAREAFRGVVSIETANTVYCFADGVFANRTRKPEEIPEATPAMKGIRLIGFLSPENGHWALSLHWKQGSLAVLRKPGLPDEQALILTTVTQSFVLDAPAEARTHTAPRIFKRPEAPPTFRRPSPPSMTRLMPAAAPKLC